MAVETAHAAIAAASSQAPSIVLLDLGLPDMDGVKVVESVRAWSGMPIIVVSARSGMRTRFVRSMLAPTIT
ncbi:MAG: response regulator [Collinsella sp.]